jgi:hypothetical protein
VTAFFDTILSSDLKQVADHWREAKGTRAMPAWTDLRPSAIASQLPIVWSYKYDPETGEFTGRLAGERITRLFGKDFRGTPMAHIQPASDFPWVYALCKRIVNEPAFYRGTGLMYRHLDRYGTGERIVLPLSSDGRVADGIVGVTEYRLDPRQADPATPIPRETEQWFPLYEAAFQTA